MPTRPALPRTAPDWPRDDFLAWLDATKATLGLEKDAHFAAHVGIGHYLISAWRAAKQRPSMEVLNAIADRLGEDPRRLWVLCGWVRAENVGLLDDEQDALPDEIRQLVQVYRDPRLDEADRVFFLRAIKGIRQSVIAELEGRQPQTGDGVEHRAG